MLDVRIALPSPAAMRRLGLFAVPLLTIAVACSNGDDAADATQTPAEPSPSAAAIAAGGDDASAGGSEAPADGGDQAEAAASAAAALDFGSGTGSITLLGETHTLEIGPGTGLCRDVFDMIQAGGRVAGDRDIEGSFSIPPLDWESYEDQRYDPPSVELEITSTGDDNANWIADAAWATANDRVGESQVDSYEKDGTTASGTATFANAWDPADESVEGTWEVSCAES